MPVHENPRSGQHRGGLAPRHNQPGGQQDDAWLARIKFNKDDQPGKKLDPELFSSIAREAAQRVAANRSSNKSTQLRRFYDELCLWNQRVPQNGDKFDEYRPFIMMLNAKVAYAQGRGLVDDTYARLLQHTLSEVKNRESLAVCKLFWEAFTGFYKQERQD